MLESKAASRRISRCFVRGTRSFYGRTFHCWRQAGHGTVDLHKAIVDSCDVFFYTVGQRWASIASHNTPCGSAWASGRASICRRKKPGLMPSEEWEERVFHQKWYAGETISVAIGQGAVTVTPLQLARMIGGGRQGRRFSAAAPADDQSAVPESISRCRRIRSSRSRKECTASSTKAARDRAVKLQNIEFSGKSGTAQLMSYEAEAARWGQKGQETMGGSSATRRGAIRKSWLRSWSRAGRARRQPQRPGGARYRQGVLRQEDRAKESEVYGELSAHEIRGQVRRCCTAARSPNLKRCAPAPSSQHGRAGVGQTLQPVKRSHERRHKYPRL